MFPKLVFAIRDGLDHRIRWPNYDIKQLALGAPATRSYPDILSATIPGGESHRVVLKRRWAAAAFLGVWEKQERGEQVHDGRNNLGVISLNLPRIATEAKGDETATSGRCWTSCGWRAKR
ncbi:hypothetical protein MJ561_03445 [Klebsiella pneumoniae]|nr:hypothetical protein MJ561_03445 [Klebsiella pneumoniae]